MKKFKEGMFGPHLSKEKYDLVRKAYNRKRRNKYGLYVAFFLLGFALSQFLGRAL